MTSLADRLQGRSPVPHHRPWPRYELDEKAWVELASDGGSNLDLLGLWGDPPFVHMALFDPAARTLAVASLRCEEGVFPSVGALHPPAIRLERAVRDLWGLMPADAPDLRPWLTDTTQSYPFLAAEGPGLHQIPVGPIHAGIIEPGHFRFTCNGETVVRLEQRLGWAHKGIERLVQGMPVARAARVVGRVSGDSTVAYALAFARAVEVALGIEAPPRAQVLRGLMAELERVANHLGDFGAICNDAAFAIMLSHGSMLRESVLQAAASCFGHRLMMDRIVPGGTVSDLDNAGAGHLRELACSLRSTFAGLVQVYDNTPSLQDRTVATGIVPPGLIRIWAPGGYVGRASARAFDVRRALPYAPYETLSFEVPVLAEGDVNARVWVRIREIEQSLSMIEQLLDRMPGGPITTALPPPRGSVEGMALVESFRGDVLVWLRLAPDLTVERCHPRDPSWFQWPLLEAAIEGNIVADFPLCNKSFNCSYAGHDL
jgi:Ni,Fe-hydrogenase III large subunit